MQKPFPVTAKDEPRPTDPKDERSREEIAAQPEDLTERVERTRRYFRLTRKATKLRYAKGLDTAPDDFA